MGGRCGTPPCVTFRLVGTPPPARPSGLELLEGGPAGTRRYPRSVQAGVPEVPGVYVLAPGRAPAGACAWACTCAPAPRDRHVHVRPAPPRPAVRVACSALCAGCCAGNGCLNVGSCVLQKRFRTTGGVQPAFVDSSHPLWGLVGAGGYRGGGCPSAGNGAAALENQIGQHNGRRTTFVGTVGIRVPGLRITFHSLFQILHLQDISFETRSCLFLYPPAPMSTPLLYPPARGDRPTRPYLAAMGWACPQGCIGGIGRGGAPPPPPAGRPAYAQPVPLSP